MPLNYTGREISKKNRLGSFYMGITLIKIKIMHESPEVNLHEIKEEAKKIIEKNKARRIVFEEQPIAFGLKAIIAGFEQDEADGELEPIESGLKKLKDVSSVEVVDMRRAFGWKICDIKPKKRNKKFN